MRPLRIPNTDTPGDNYLRRLLRRVALVPFVTTGTFAEIARLPLDRAASLLEQSWDGWEVPFTRHEVLVDPHHRAVPWSVYTLSSIGIDAAFQDLETGAIAAQRAHTLVTRTSRHPLHAAPMGSREWHAARFLGLLVALVTAAGHPTIQVLTWRSDADRHALGLPRYTAAPDGFAVLRRRDGGLIEVAIVTIDNLHQLTAVRRDIHHLVQRRKERPSSHPVHVLVWAATPEVEAALRDRLHVTDADLGVPCFSTNGALLPLAPSGITALNPGLTALRLGQDVWASVKTPVTGRVPWLPLLPPGRP